MTYDGKVASGGPAQTRDVGNARISKLSVGPMDNNVYLISCKATGEALLIDAAADWPRIRDLVASSGVAVVALATTHRHSDHTGALQDAVDAWHPRTYAGRDDAAHLPVEAAYPMDDRDGFTVGRVDFAISAVRGHTPGSIAISFVDADDEHHLFTGDSLFPGGVGATNHYDYQSFPQLIDDVEARLFGRFDDDTWVYPGHGADTTIGTERPQLPQWRERGW
ncbi:MBL fold metallo-hydrolase [Calidifontibacter sp. DB0510]|uniref:MBL fold metallo-hydrolase n=1 Tax=Metallococcus carri TaxID=1656884 RepID=A0A967AZZ7_9MICO|nr:MBL fold metallo-hydrolase [Metallococcus carri]NHN54920.1 MBL fold metallo-hydrolase [Metallococcus carri]NOP37266.1 MBL fold metallo-hydrolase [Calidifontibacter sp. DB2511S]